MNGSISAARCAAFCRSSLVANPDLRVNAATAGRVGCGRIAALGAAKTAVWGKMNECCTPQSWGFTALECGKVAQEPGGLVEMGGELPQSYLRNFNFCTAARSLGALAPK